MSVIDRQDGDVADGLEPLPAIAKLELEGRKAYFRRREALREYINDHGIKRMPPGSKELPSIDRRGFYDWQFYLRSTLLIPKHLVFIANRFWATFADRFVDEPFQITGVEQACMPMLTAILLRGANLGLTVPAFTIRKERKAYGMRNLIEGEFDPYLPVVFIDDLTSPEHLAFWHAVYALSLHGLRLYPYGFVLVRKQKAEESPLIRTSIGDVAIEDIFTLDDFTLTYEDYGKLSV